MDVLFNWDWGLEKVGSEYVCIYVCTFAIINTLNEWGCLSCSIVVGFFEYSCESLLRVFFFLVGLMIIRYYS